MDLYHVGFVGVFTSVSLSGEQFFVVMLLVERAGYLFNRFGRVRFYARKSTR